MKKTIIIIAALALASLSYGKNVKSQLEEMATFANKQTPIIMGNGMTWIIDSIQYDKNKNLYSYYYSSLLIYDDVLSYPKGHGRGDPQATDMLNHTRG